jgi:hypothetical protein
MLYRLGQRGQQQAQRLTKLLDDAAQYPNVAAQKKALEAERKQIGGPLTSWRC